LIIAFGFGGFCAAKAEIVVKNAIAFCATFARS
jgi:hypothetical protein